MLPEVFVFSSLTWYHCESATATENELESISPNGEKMAIFGVRKRKINSETLHVEEDKEVDTLEKVSREEVGVTEES